MQKRQLGTSELQVRPVGLGLWAMGGDQWGPTEDAQSLATISRAVELGIDFFDTADVYGDGHSEEILGKAMRGRRDRFVVATKIGWRAFDGTAGRSAYQSPEAVIADVETNLQRLQTDYIDLLQWHVNFREPGMENFIAGCDRLVEQGKLRAYGLSTGDPQYVEDFFTAGSGDSLQLDYSILNRIPEQRIFPFTSSHGKATIIRGGMAMGLLAGKFSPDSRFAQTDFRKAWIEDPEQNRQFLADLETVARLKEAFPGQNLAQLSLRFLLSNPAVTVIIPGAKRVDQLEANFQAMEFGPLTTDELHAIDAIVPPGGGRKIWPA